MDLNEFAKFIKDWEKSNLRPLGTNIEIIFDANIKGEVRLINAGKQVFAFESFDELLHLLEKTK